MASTAVARAPVADVRPMTPDEKRVIFASSLGTIIIASLTFVVGMLFVKETKDSDVYDG